MQTTSSTPKYSARQQVWYVDHHMPCWSSLLFRFGNGQEKPCLCMCRILDPSQASPGQTFQFEKQLQNHKLALSCRMSAQNLFQLCSKPYLKILNFRKRADADVPTTQNNAYEQATMLLNECEPDFQEWFFEYCCFQITTDPSPIKLLNENFTANYTKRCAWYFVDASTLKAAALHRDDCFVSRDSKYGSQPWLINQRIL